MQNFLEGGRQHDEAESQGFEADVVQIYGQKNQINFLDDNLEISSSNLALTTQLSEEGQLQWALENSYNVTSHRKK